MFLIFNGVHWHNGNEKKSLTNGRMLEYTIDITKDVEISEIAEGKYYENIIQSNVF